MIAEDLLAAIALDAFGARVPAADPALQVEHIERVVGHALDQQAQLLLALPQLLLSLAPLGQVAGDLGVADQAALRVADRIDDHVGPEPAASLADAPALVFEAALFPRRAKGGFRQAGRLVLVSVETGEVLSEDLFLAVALEPLGAPVPARHPAFRIQHVDGVVADALDQQPVTALVGQGFSETCVLQPGAPDIALARNHQLEESLGRLVPLQRAFPPL